MDQEIKYLNSFSVLSFDVNNIYVSFQAKNYFFSNKQWKKNIFSYKKNNVTLKKEDKLQKTQYWLVFNDKGLVLTQINTYDQKQTLNNFNYKLIGPFFDTASANFVLDSIKGI